MLEHPDATLPEVGTRSATCRERTRTSLSLCIAASAAVLLFAPAPAVWADALQSPPPSSDSPADATQPPPPGSETPAETPVDAPDPEAAFAEDVLVTARLLEEKGQAVPLTVTYLDAEQLEQQGVAKVSDLTYTVPSLTIHPYFNTLTNSYSIRGLSAGQSTYFSESPCCSGNASIPLTDIESVQVLNGPQGTLFGRSSASGAILITPVHPRLDEWGTTAKLTLGDYGRKQLSGALNVPLIKERLAVRLSLSVNDIDGYTEALGSDLRFDEQRNQTIRVGTQLNLGRFDNYAAATYIHLDQSATNQILSGIHLGAADGLYLLPASIAPAVFGSVCTRAVALGLEPDVDTCVTSRYNRLAAIRAALLGESARVSAGGDAVRFEPAPVDGNPARLQLESYSIIDVAQYDLLDEAPLSLKLKNIFSFEAAADVASSPADGIGGLAEQGGASSVNGYGSSNQRGRFVVPRLGPRTRTFNDELQLHFNARNGLLSGTTGFFYNYYKQPATDRGTGNIYQIFGGVFNENRGYNSAVGFPAGADGDEIAAYTQATLDLSPWIRGLKLTGGYRFSWTHTSSASRPAVVDPVTGVFSPGETVSKLRTSSSGPNYHFALSEQWTDRFMSYVTLSRAYVPGGVNVYDSGQAGGDPATALPNFAPTYGPEKVLAAELGFKWDFNAAGVIGRINAGVYRYWYTDIQENFSGTFNNVGFFYIANIAAAAHQGFETSATFIPSKAWEIRLSYNYNDFYYTKWTGQDPANVALPGDPICEPSSPAGYCFLDLTDNPAVGMPPHQGHLTVAYDVPISSSLGRLNLAATLYGQARVYFQSNAHRELQILGRGALQAYSQDPYTLVNLRASWSSIRNSPWGAAVFVDNVGNRTYKLGTTAQVLSLGFGTAHYGPPRMFGVQLTRTF